MYCICVRNEVTSFHLGLLSEFMVLFTNQSSLSLSPFIYLRIKSLDKQFHSCNALAYEEVFRYCPPQLHPSKPWYIGSLKSLATVWTGQTLASVPSYTLHLSLWVASFIAAPPWHIIQCSVLFSATVYLQSLTQLLLKSSGHLMNNGIENEWKLEGMDAPNS